MSEFPLDTENSPSLLVELLFDLKVRDVMCTELVTAEKHSSLADIQALMKTNGVSGIPIVEGRRLVGIISVDDIIRALAELTINDHAEKHMTRNLIVLEDDMPLSFAISYLEKYKFGRFPVLNKERELAGIITSRDIIVHLLININKELEQIEDQRRRNETPASASPESEGSQLPIEEAGAVEPDSTAAVARQWHTRKFDFEEAGKASTEIKRLLKEVRPDVSRKIIRRIAIASYELEMNQVVHSEGGEIHFLLQDNRVSIIARDTGPGISDLESALTEGWSTATEWVRSLGFGAGMGLPNTRRVADVFHIESTDKGTIVEANFNLDDPEQGVDHG